MDFLKEMDLWMLLPEQRELMSESDVLKFNSIEARQLANEKIQVKENSKYGILGRLVTSKLRKKYR